MPQRDSQLMRSSESVREGVIEIDRKLVQLLGLMSKHGRMVSRESEETKNSLRYYRRMARRHLKGHFAHTAYELASMHYVARWAVETWHDLKGTKPDDQSNPFWSD